MTRGRHVLREEYGTFKLTADHGIDGRLMEGLYHFVLRLHQEWTLLPALLFPGVLSLCRQRGAGRWFVSTCSASVVFYLVVFHYMANIELHDKPDQQNIVRRFWLMPFIVRSPVRCSALLPLLTSRADTQSHHRARLPRVNVPTFAQRLGVALPRFGPGCCVGFIRTSPFRPERERLHVAARPRVFGSSACRRVAVTDGRYCHQQCIPPCAL